MGTKRVSQIDHFFHALIPLVFSNKYNETNKYEQKNEIETENKEKPSINNIPKKEIAHRIEQTTRKLYNRKETITCIEYELKTAKNDDNHSIIFS